MSRQKTAIVCAGGLGHHHISRRKMDEKARKKRGIEVK